MLTAVLTAMSSVVRQARFGDPKNKVEPAIEAPRETLEQPESRDQQGCETIRGCFRAMGMNHLEDE